jgi:hypothetical protein
MILVATPAVVGEGGEKMGSGSIRVKDDAAMPLIADIVAMSEVTGAENEGR